MKQLISAAIASIILAAGLSSFAEAAGKLPPKIIYRKKTTIDFSDAIVEGNTDNPEGVYIVKPPEKQFGALLKLRPNFHRELIRDSLLLK